MRENGNTSFDDYKFSLAHPVNDKILDIDIFLHGTSSDKYKLIKTEGLKRHIEFRNFGISQNVICLEKYPKDQYARKRVIDLLTRKYCKSACENDGSLECVILQINGKDLKKLGCPICVDWNYGVPREFNGLDPIGVKFDLPYNTIVILHKDIPGEYLKIFKQIPLKDLDSEKSS